MGKRFTANEKWHDPWFRKLPLKFKCFWFYICENCDPAGVWNVDMELVSWLIGDNFNQDEILSKFNGRIEKVGNGDYWFLPKFIQFQYGELKEDYNPHKPVIRSLAHHHLISRVGQGLFKGQWTLMDKDKDKDKDKKEDIGKGMKRFQKPTPKEITQYALTLGYTLDGQRFFDHYEANGWVRGKTHIKDWKACVRTWKSNEGGSAPEKSEIIR